MDNSVEKILFALGEEIQEKMIASKKMLALAESCTGGYAAHILTQRSGASGYFLGSFVTYADEMKRDVLQVPEELLRLKGAVSEEVVLEMVRGVFLASKADYAIAWSGIAGPAGGSEDKPVGTVFVAMGERGKEAHFFCLHLQGTRLLIIQESLLKGLQEFKKYFL